jgi:hypothetical protein
MAYATLFGIILFGISLSQTTALKDGDIHQFISSLDGKALTVANSEPEAGSKLSLEPWQDESTQKWLAVEAVVAADNYLLVSRRQKWDWNKFERREGTLKDRHDTLPDFTLVLNVGKDNALSQEFRDSKPPQQWRSIRVEGKPYHLIKNIGTDRCLRNPGAPKTKNSGVFQRIKQATQVLARGTTQKPKEPKFAYAEMAVCDNNDAGQQWNVDKVN